MLQDHNEDDAGAGGSEEASTSILDSGVASDDTARVGSLGAAGPLSPFLTAPRMTSSNSFARLLTTGGVDGNACRSAAISAGGCSTSLNTKRFESTYLETPSTLAARNERKPLTQCSRPPRAQCGPATRARRGRPRVGRWARRRCRASVCSTDALACPTR